MDDLRVDIHGIVSAHVVQLPKTREAIVVCLMSCEPTRTLSRNA